MRLTKIDAAEQLIISAVRLFLADAHIVPVLALANAAREILLNLGEHTKAVTLQQQLADNAGVSPRERTKSMRDAANFLKHADRDPTRVLDLDEELPEQVLFIACHDFGRIAKGMPIEAQVLEAWRFAQVDRVSDLRLSQQETIRRVIRFFPGIRRASPSERKRIGLEVLNKAAKDNTLRMKIVREVRLPGPPEAEES